MKKKDVYMFNPETDEVVENDENASVGLIKRGDLFGVWYKKANFLRKGLYDYQTAKKMVDYEKELTRFKDIFIDDICDWLMVNTSLSVEKIVDLKFSYKSV